jgi:hypothetical protein
MTGVTVTFLTTLERIPQGPGGPPPGGDDFEGQGGMPIILGTSQTQLVTGQDGLASITPTVENLGPCDAFITVTAGNSTAQFDLQSVDPLTSTQEQPKNHSIKRRKQIAAFGSNVLAPQENAAVLFALPQEMPPAESPSEPCLNADQNSRHANGDPSSSTLSEVLAGVSEPRPCDSSKSAEVQAVTTPIAPPAESFTQAQKRRMSRDRAALKPSPVGAPLNVVPDSQPPGAPDSARSSASERETYDKRSCRFALKDDSITP